MDLDNIDIPNTAKIHLEFLFEKMYDDEEKTLPTTIEVYGPASKQAVDFDIHVKERALERVSQRGTGAFRMTALEIKNQESDRFVAHTASINNLTYKGELVTLESVKNLYSDPRMKFICDQIEKRIGTLEGFLGLR